MTTQPNEAQAAAWNNAQGVDWVRQHTRFDGLLTEILDLVLTSADPRPGEQVLDIGCGGGATTMAAARRIGPDGAALGLDISAVLLDHARRQAEGLSNVRFQLGDAQVHPLEPDRFDLMMSRFGVMFFEDPVAAFANLARALRPTGRLAMIAWASPALNPWFAVPMQAAVARLGPPEPADPDAPGPMAFRDIDRVTGILRAAGLQDCAGSAVQTYLTPIGDLEEVMEFALHIGPASRLITAKAASEADRAAIKDVLRPEFARFEQNGQMRVPACVNLFTARRTTGAG
ncbi:methyltransferase domain-containing protein [bacterium]|nr:methyltransferase domain-containing protein [bacterium]